MPSPGRPPPRARRGRSSPARPSPPTGPRRSRRRRRPPLAPARATTGRRAASGRRPAGRPGRPRARNPRAYHGIPVDLTPTREQEAFRNELRSWLARAPARGSTAGCRHTEDLADEVAALREWQAQLAAGRWIGVTWPEEYGGRGAGAAAPLHRAGGAGPGPGPRAGRTHRHQPRRADAAGPRHARAEGPLAAEDPGRRRAVVPALQRARRGLRPRRAWRRRPNGSTAAGRSPARRSGPPTPSSPTGGSASPAPIPTAAEAPGHLRLRGRHARPRRRGPAAGPDHGRGRVQRGLLRRRLRPRRPPDRRRERRLAGLLARRSPTSGGRTPASSSSTPSWSRSCSASPSSHGRYDDVRLQRKLAEAFVEVRLFQLHNWRSLSRLAAGKELGPEGSTLKLYWSEMSKRLHETVMAVLGRRRTAVAGGRRQPRRRRVATVVALLPRRLGVRRDERDPAQHHRRARPGPPPRAPPVTGPVNRGGGNRPSDSDGYFLH